MGSDFGYEKQMLQLIDELKINNKVHVIKNLPRNDVVAAYNECEFLVLPSRWELSPLTPLEGFAFKKAVISTTAHGIPYTIKNDINSILVEPSNSHELARAIITLIQDAKFCEKLGNSGYESVRETQNADSMVKKILEIYQGLK